MKPKHPANDLHLLLLNGVRRVLNLDVGLQRLLSKHLVVAVLDLHHHLEGELLQGRYLVSEVTRVLVDGNPDAHRMRLHQAVELVDAEALVDVPLQLHHVLDAASLIPVVYLVVNPATIFEDLETLLASQELADEDVEVVALKQGVRELSLRNELGFFCLLLHEQETFSLDPFRLALDQVLDVLGLEQEVDGHLVEAGLLKNAQGGPLDLFVAMDEEVAEHGQAPAVEVEVALPVELPEGLDDALGEVGRAVLAPLPEQVPGR